ncbi:hypothetical protein EDC63_102125 [Sulfurirhabdus autotrophica]|uniref:Uncharacterized protein n=1 Tax=Sulfurirhabdus autotrophica TaxID=1706046 RepID=A0A4R3YC15_9PROT|nr:hypothetical protein EDC63_102125 [Sulfurirhabdus autotrophica]
MNNRTLYLLLLFISSVVLTSCAGVEPLPASCNNCAVINFVNKKDAETIDTLQYISRVRGLQGDELNREYTSVLQALAKQKTAVNRIKLAFLLCLPNTNFKDDVRANSLLAEVFEDKKDNSSIANLAALLANQTYELKRQEERFQKMNQAMKDEQKRADQLQQKLDALKNIEKSIIQRESKTVPSK